MLKSIEGNFDDPEVHELLTKHFIELRAASPEGSAHVLDIPGLKVPSIKFWSLWLNDKLMGCGALKFLDKDHGEFKSINDFFKFHLYFGSFIDSVLGWFSTSCPNFTQPFCLYLFNLSVGIILRCQYPNNVTNINSVMSN